TRLRLLQSCLNELCHHSPNWLLFYQRRQVTDREVLLTLHFGLVRQPTAWAPHHVAQFPPQHMKESWRSPIHQLETFWLCAEHLDEFRPVHGHAHHPLPKLRKLCAKLGPHLFHVTPLYLISVLIALRHAAPLRRSVIIRMDD